MVFSPNSIVALYLDALGYYLMETRKPFMEESLRCMPEAASFSLGIRWYQFRVAG